MSSTQQLLLGEGAGGAAPNYIEDVFSTWLYTGNGNATSRTIQNEIDLSTKGGMVWIKNRTSAIDHDVTDTARGARNPLFTNRTYSQDTNVDYAVNSFLTNGFTLASTDSLVNQNNQNYVSWTFREQAKFFDIATFTSNASGGGTFTHNLGSEPGFIIVKSSSNADQWTIYHRSLGRSGYMYLNTTAANNPITNFWTVSSTSVTYANDYGPANASMVAYLFAHNAGGFGLTGTDNVISCGSFTTDGSGNATVNLGYEPQWVLMKPSTTATSGNWIIADNMRGWTIDGAGGNANQQLYANNTDAESGGTPANLTSTGFNFTSGGYSPWANQTWIYIAIRRGPMKVPTSGTSVFSPVAQAGNGGNDTITTGFTTDLVIGGSRTANPIQGAVDRLRGNTKALLTANTASEDTSPSGRDLTSFASNTGFTLGYPPFATSYNYTGNNIYWNFRRAPSFFDEVCYTGTGAAMTVSHNLGAVPELIILKSRNNAESWMVYAAPLGNAQWLALNSTFAASSAGLRWNDTTPTSSVFSVGKFSGTTPWSSGSGYTYVAYLFATCAGVSKVGSYTGNGSSQTIACGFTAGSRFVLIKRTDSTGDWYVWDSARGIVAGNDPHLSLNTTTAEVTTDDSVDTDNSGFIVNQDAATNVNVTSATYIFLAIA